MSGSKQNNVHRDLKKQELYVSNFEKKKKP